MKQHRLLLFTAGLVLNSLAQDPSTLSEIDPLWLHHYQMAPWEASLDHDADGLSAIEEYHLGTDPRSAFSHPQFAIDLCCDDDAQRWFHIGWDGRSGVRYQLWGTHDLQAWQAWDEPITLSQDEPVVLGLVREDLPQGHQFFRVSGVSGDSDGDGLTDIVEMDVLGTNPHATDTDGDQWSDAHEVHITLTDPLVPNDLGGKASGKVWMDANEDSSPDGESASVGVEIYLDLNFDGVWTPGEPLKVSDATGLYQFSQLLPGLYHVRQRLAPGVTQTCPRPHYQNNLNGLPDEVLAYDHGDGGPHDVPYGRNADTWKGPRKVIFPAPVQPVDPDLVLQPIGNRAEVPRFGVWSTTEYLSLPKNAEITLRFDEAIIDGEGVDFLIQALNSPAGEEVRVWVGESADQLIDLGVFRESQVAIGVDLSHEDIEMPVHVVKIRSLNSAGTSPGFDLVGVEAIHYAPAAPLAHAFRISDREHIQGLDFGRVFRDLPPQVILTLSHDQTSYRPQEPFVVQVTATDDLGEVQTSLTVDDVPQHLDNDGRVVITPTTDQRLTLRAKATDVSGQSRERTLVLTIGEGEPSPSPDSFLGEAADGAPSIAIVTPEIGSVWNESVPVRATLANITGTGRWELAYASADDVDPKALGHTDSDDWHLLHEGTGIPTEDTFGSFPADTLADGAYLLRLSATNSGGATRHTAWAVGVGIEASTLRPEIVLETPSFDTNITLFESIVGSIRSERPVEWVIELAPAESLSLGALNAPGISWQSIANGSGIVEDAVLGQVDATQLVNGAYVLRVRAMNDLGLGQVEGVRIQISGEAKLGRLRRDFVDFSTTIGGLPLEMRRTYDSLTLGEPSPLGHGWSFTFANPNISETVTHSGNTPFNAAPFRQGTRVYLTAPDGRRLGFTFNPQPGATSYLGQTYRAFFEADPGVRAKLEVPQGDQSFLSINDQGEAVLFLLGFAWNPSTYILELEDGIRYHYDEEQGFIQATSPTGATLTATDHGWRHSHGLHVAFEKNAQGRLTQITDPDGLTWHYAYDEHGDLVRVTDPDGKTTRYAYQNHRLLSVTDPNGRTGTVYEYDSNGRLTATIDADGNRQEIGWDPGSFTGFTIDGAGNRTELLYNERGNIVRREDPLGNITLYQYDDSQHPDLVTTMTDAKGHSTHYRFDDQGNLTETIHPNGDATTCTWDAEGRLLSKGEPDGNRTHYRYHANGTLLFEDSPQAPSQQHTVDSHGQVILTRDALGYERRYAYDTNGHLARQIDSNGRSIEQTRDAKGRVTASNGTQFRYDAQGWPTERRDPLGNRATMERTDEGNVILTNRTSEQSIYQLNAAQELTTVVQADGERFHVRYGKNGMVTRLEYPDGTAWTFAYDALNRPTRLIDRAGKSIQLGYDEVGNRNLIINRNGKKRTFEHDNRNRLIAERWHDSDNRTVREIVYLYHRQGHLERVVDGDYEVHFQGGAYPRAWYQTYHYPGQTPYRLHYEWQKNGEDLQNPRRLRLSRDRGPILHEISAEYSGGVPQQFACTYPDGSPARIEWRHTSQGLLESEQRFLKPSSQEPISTSSYIYDALGQLIMLDHGTSLDEDECLYERDAESRITAVITPTGSRHYRYDIIGQLIEEYVEGNTAQPYQYDSLRNRLLAPGQTAKAVIGPNDTLAQAGDERFDYDEEGNLILRTNVHTGETTHYRYDHRNQLIRVERDGMECLFAYDYQGRLLSRSLNGERTWILYDRQMPIAEFADGSEALSAAYFYALDRMDHFLGSWREGVGARWFLLDHLKSVRGLLSHEGEPLAWREFTAYGELAEGNLADEPIAFAGRPWNATLGLYENRRRMLDPKLGRFIQQDPALFLSDEPNLYRYAGNNPLRWRDPMGTTSVLEYAKVALLVNDTYTLTRLGICLKGIFQAAADGINGTESSGGGSGVPCIRHLPGFPPFAL